jgi:protein-S-isoprenylcysteine O-methyltransferase Ste14
MYSSLLLLAWGAFLKSMTIYTLLLCATASLALAVTAKTEEAENLLRFGNEYRDYVKRTCRFVPFLL